MVLEQEPILNDYVHVAKSILSRMKSDRISSELGTDPVGVCTGDSSGLSDFEVLAPWTCEDCPDPYSQFKSMGAEFLETRVTGNAIHWGSIYSPATWMFEQPIFSWPTRCTPCDTRFRKHKRTINAIVRCFRHPRRMERFENTWVYTRDTTYKHLKFICLTEPNTHLLMEPPVRAKRTVVALCDLAAGATLQLAEMKEKFRRYRKRKFWQDHVVYGRWFAEVTWTVHYPAGPGPTTQWMPTSKELEGAVSVEIHPHLHVIAVAKFMDKEDLTSWWENGTHVQATDSWWSTKKYLTKYLNKQQFEGRNQGTFGKTT